MKYQTSLSYHGQKYSIRFRPRLTGKAMVYTVQLGADGLDEQHSIEITPDIVPDSTILFWTENGLHGGGPKLDPHFIQAIGEAIEAHDE